MAMGCRAGGVPRNSTRPAIDPFPIKLPAVMAPAAAGGGWSPEPPQARSPVPAPRPSSRAAAARRRIGRAGLLAEDRIVAGPRHEEEPRDQKPGVGPGGQERL